MTDVPPYTVSVMPPTGMCGPGVSRMASYGKDIQGLVPRPRRIEGQVEGYAQTQGAGACLSGDGSSAALLLALCFAIVVSGGPTAPAPDGEDPTELTGVRLWVCPEHDDPGLLLMLEGQALWASTFR